MSDLTCTSHFYVMRDLVCGMPAVALVTYGCVHEHFVVDRPKCQSCMPEAHGFICGDCRDADGHSCKLGVISVVELTHA